MTGCFIILIFEKFLILVMYKLLSFFFIQAIKYLQTGGESQILNCGYGVGYSVKDVVNSIQKMSGVQIEIELKPRRAGDPIAVWADNTKIVKLLGWKPQHHNLDLICKTSLDWEKTS